MSARPSDVTTYFSWLPREVFAMVEDRVSTRDRLVLECALRGLVAEKAEDSPESCLSETLLDEVCYPREDLVAVEWALADSHAGSDADSHAGSDADSHENSGGIPPPGWACPRGAALRPTSLSGPRERRRHKRERRRERAARDARRNLPGPRDL